MRWLVSFHVLNGAVSFPHHFAERYPRHVQLFCQWFIHSTHLLISFNIYLISHLLTTLSLIPLRVLKMVQGAFYSSLVMSRGDLPSCWRCDPCGTSWGVRAQRAVPLGAGPCHRAPELLTSLVSSTDISVMPSASGLTRSWMHFNSHHPLTEASRVCLLVTESASCCWRVCNVQ